MLYLYNAIFVSSNGPLGLSDANQNMRVEQERNVPVFCIWPELFFRNSRHFFFLKWQCQHHWDVFGCASQKSSNVSAKWNGENSWSGSVWRDVLLVDVAAHILFSLIHTPLLSAQGQAHPRSPYQGNVYEFQIWSWRRTRSLKYLNLPH